jgi:hypothetical protein
MTKMKTQDMGYWFIRHEDRTFTLYWGGPSQGWVKKKDAEIYDDRERAETELPRGGMWERER